MRPRNLGQDGHEPFVQVRSEYLGPIDLALVAGLRLPIPSDPRYFRGCRSLDPLANHLCFVELWPS